MEFYDREENNVGAINVIRLGSFEVKLTANEMK
jgi:hypothetical protein